jgi:hypothetical protein
MHLPLSTDTLKVKGFPAKTPVSLCNGNTSGTCVSGRTCVSAFRDALLPILPENNPRLAWIFPKSWKTCLLESIFTLPVLRVKITGISPAPLQAVERQIQGGERVQRYCSNPKTTKHCTQGVQDFEKKRYQTEIVMECNDQGNIVEGHKFLKTLKKP